jgi:preprotein translocase subunit SecF
MLELIKKPNIDFVGKRYYMFIFSGILVFIGILAFIMVILGKAKLSIDFTSGALIQIKFQKPISIEEIRNRLTTVGLGQAEIQSFTRENRVLIRSKFDPNLPLVIKKLFQDRKIEIERVESVGPKVGKQLRYKAIRAIVIALIGLLLYIAFRFEFRYGVAAVIATLHDVIVVLGIVWVLQREINLLVITALLTLAGYSLTDTVVVFDRIRQNLKLYKKKESLESIINRSINEVLSRTIITSLTTALVLIALLIKGTIVTFSFALTMLIGVIIGTYSSIYIASPILIEWQRLRPKKL